MKCSWENFLNEEKEKDYYQKLITFVDEQYLSECVFPDREDLFNAFKYCDFDKLKVVIIGQDPYHNHNQAHGLAFSTLDSKVPKSLRNIFIELKNDLGVEICGNNLSCWAKQGVLLINTIMTVKKNQPMSHKLVGWEKFVDNAIIYINKYKNNIVYILWGNNAFKSARLINDNNLIIKSSHPSPLSCRHSFFDSKPFSRCNQYLLQTNQIPIDFSVYEYTDCDSAINYITNCRNINGNKEVYSNYINSIDNIEKLKIIHVAGTNGKGSCVNFIRSVLNTNKYKVATFTSPHLITHLDRIRINDINISKHDFLRLFNQRVMDYKKLNFNMFEIDLDIAIRYYIECEVDFVILEVGLGGRFDSTNYIKNTLMSVIVSIGLDHIDRLGDTVEKIAFEKCQIVKQNGILINGVIQDSCQKILKDHCKVMNADLKIIAPYKITRNSPLNFTYQNNDYELNTIAKYQVNNASVAIECINYLQDNKIVDISQKQIFEGIKQADWKGRFQIIDNSPLTIVDGAHNMPAIDSLCKNIADLPKPICIVFACLKDKDKTQMISKLSENCDKLIITEFEFYRCLKLEDIDEDDSFEKIKDFKKAIKVAKNYAGNTGCVLITGSLYFISDVLSLTNKA